jgi:hypothetical protein
VSRLLRRLAGSVVKSPVELPDGVSVVQGRWIPWIGGIFTGGRAAAAVTLGNTIVVHPDAILSAELLRHELEHVRQWRQDGWRFPFRYARLFVRYGYRQNPYEVAARGAEQPTP